MTGNAVVSFIIPWRLSCSTGCRLTLVRTPWNSIGPYAFRRRPRTLLDASNKPFDSPDEYPPKVSACQCRNIERDRKAKVIQSNTQAKGKSLGSTFTSGLASMTASDGGVGVRADA